jgi:perosamine synthetase
MKHAVVGQTIQNRTETKRQKDSVRRVALIGGTTTLDDSLAALYYLVHPRQLVEGAAISEFEHAFAQSIGVRYAYSFCHGRVGLYGLLRGLEIGPGDEVLLQVPTHIVVTNAIRYTGARPVYVDCRLDNYNMDLELAEQHISSRTKALILQHTFGIPVDLDAALNLARRHSLTLIEDCVHALGATYGGRPVGGFGRAAFFSSEETKTISTTMGGMVVTDDPELAARIQKFQQSCALPSAWQTFRYILKLVLYHGMTEPHVHQYTRAIYEFFGKFNPLPQPTTDEETSGNRPTNYEQRFSNAQAALGLRQLRRLGENVSHRRAIATAYHKRLTAEGFNLPHPPVDAEPAFVRYPVWVEDPALAVRVATRRATLGTWFSSVLEEADSPACGEYEMGSCPRAEAAARHLINLPTNPRVTEQDVDAIISAVIQADGLARSQDLRALFKKG